MTHKLIYLLFSLFAFSIVSCDALKPATSGPRDDQRNEDRARGNDEDLDPIQSRRVYDPETGTYIYVRNSPTEKMDTVQWTVTPEERMPPIVDNGTSTYTPPPNTNTNPAAPGPATQLGSGNNGSRLLSAYNVEYALPFLTNKYLGSEDKVDANSLWALHFYSGAQMAMDELRSQSGTRSTYYVDVKDTQAEPGRTQSLTQSPSFNAAQVVIGPYVKGNVSTMANAVKGKETVLVSPFSAGAGISNQNPNYVQVNPTLNTHLRGILDHAMKSQNSDRIVLVTDGSDAQKGRLTTLQEDWKLLNNNAKIAPLEELTVDINNADATFAEYLTGNRTVFIVPVYENESFVANFLRKLYSETREDFGKNVAVYGLPQWVDFTRINFDYYEGTNVHVSSSVHIDLLDPAVRSFRREFYDRFATLPRDEAYVGYDVTRYFMRMLAEHGTRFQYDLPANPETLLHTKFWFEPVYAVGADGMAVENAPIERFENKYVNILRFRDFMFRRVN